jgi:two-component system, NarL family, sensor kinase
MMTTGRRRAFVVLWESRAGVGRRLVGMLPWVLWALTVLVLAAVPWLDQLLRQAGRPDLIQLTPETVPPALALVSAATVGAVLASRRPRHPVGWLLVALALSLIAASAAAQYLTWGLLVRPGSLPAAGLVARYYPALGFIVLTLIGFVLLLTPTGSLPSPRWWARAMVAAPVVLLVVVTLADGRLDPRYQALGGPFELRALGGVLLVANQVALAVTTLVVVVAAGSLVMRFRRARGLERLQLRWVALGAVVMALAAAIAVVGLALGARPLLDWPIGISVALLPLAIGAAILRYRLYDLHYLISRTVVYGLLTVAGIAVYVAVVKLAEWLLREGAGLGGSLLATAVIAIGFAPARDRLQRWVDRRLYGERHDPVQAMVQLGERLRDAPGGAPDGDALAGVLQGVCQALRLPSASLRIEDGAEVASFGRPADASESIPLEHEGQQIGVLLVGVRSGEDALGVADRQVLEVLAAPVAVALHAVLLSQELQRSRERLVAAREEERRRLRRDLHDGLGPILTAVTLKADAARSALDSAPTQADGLLAELRGDAKQAIGDLRRVVEDLRPAALDELGLLGALSQQMDRFARQGVSITLDAPPTLPVLPAAVEVAAYRIIAEALTNIARHAYAHQITITVAINGSLCVAVQDDGMVSTANGDRWRPGVGLLSMAERVAEIGGTLQAGPTPTGGRVKATLPLELA